jgi:flagellar basal-body rod modification protein FlgD
MLTNSQNASVSAPPVLALNTSKGTHNLNVATTEKNGSLGKSAAVKGGVEESQERFLKLLVTQMKNQDPLNPLDNAQVTSQMAQLSTVSGIDKLNSTLAALSNSMTGSQSMQAASMIGHVVMVPGNKIELRGEQGIAGLDLEQPADSVTVQIKDAAGNVIRNMNIGSQASGVLPLKWDGMTDDNVACADGHYQITASATLGGKNSEVKTLSYGLVSAVVQKPEGARLNVDHIGEIGMEAVKQIL